VKARAAEIGAHMPSTYGLAFPRDTSDFVRLSIREVVETLLMAIVFVVVVMYVFLQSWRATLVPAIAVPVVILGTMAVLAVFGYSINTMTLFGMVLSIGLLVDDAIVVVENVERLMEEKGLDPRSATLTSMDELGSALFGVALVLCAVMLPMAFFGGSTGVIYRQFSVTIVTAMLLSVMVALFLSPPLCATVLKPKTDRSPTGLVQLTALRAHANIIRRHRRPDDPAATSIRHRLRLLILVIPLIFARLPTEFLPQRTRDWYLCNLHYLRARLPSEQRRYFMKSSVTFSSTNGLGRSFIHVLGEWLVRERPERRRRLRNAARL